MLAYQMYDSPAVLFGWDLIASYPRSKPQAKESRMHVGQCREERTEREHWLPRIPFSSRPWRFTNTFFVLLVLKLEPAASLTQEQRGAFGAAGRLKHGPGCRFCAQRRAQGLHGPLLHGAALTGPTCARWVCRPRQVQPGVSEHSHPSTCSADDIHY